MPLLLEARRLGGFIQKYHLRWRWHHLYLWPIILCWKTIKLLKLKVFWLLFSFVVVGPTCLKLSEWVTFAKLNLCDSGWWRYHSTLTDDANGTVQGNVAMQVTQPGGQLWKQCKWCHQIWSRSRGQLLGPLCPWVLNCLNYFKMFWLFTVGWTDGLDPT